MKISRRIREQDKKSENDLGDAEIKQSWMQLTAAQLIDDELKKAAFLSLIQEFPSLSSEFNSAWDITFSPECPLSPWRLALMLNKIAETLASKGDFLAAATCLQCSSLFIKSNPLTWAASAWVAYAWEDKVAIKWATKVIAYRVTERTPSELYQQLSGDQGRELLKETRSQMKLLIKFCNLSCNDHWRDTSALLEQTGTSQSYFDR